MVTSLLVGFVAVSLVVVAIQISCVFAYQEEKKGEFESAIPNGCTEQ